jgi:hypothetical protein
MQTRIYARRAGAEATGGRTWSRSRILHRMRDDELSPVLLPDSPKLD